MQAIFFTVLVDMSMLLGALRFSARVTDAPMKEKVAFTSLGPCTGRGLRPGRWLDWRQPYAGLGGALEPTEASVKTTQSGMTGGGRAGRSQKALVPAAARGALLLQTVWP